MGIWLGINYFFFPGEPPKTVKKTDTVDNSSQKKLGKEDGTQQAFKKADPSIITKNIISPADIKKYYIKTASFLVQFSSLGGRIEKFYIKNYKDLEGNEVLIAKNDSTKIKFNNEEFKAVEISRNKGFDFNPAFSREEILSMPFANINFYPTFDEKNLVLTFDGTSQNGKLKIRKEFKFFKNENYFKFSLHLQNSSSAPFPSPGENNLFLKSFSSLGPIRNEKEISDKDMANYFRFYYIDNSFKTAIDGGSAEGFFSSVVGGDSDNDDRFETIKSASAEGVDYAGTGSRYFIGVIDPLDHKADGVILNNQKNNITGAVIYYNNIVIPPGQTISYHYAAYAGVRELDGMNFRSKELDPKITRNSEFKNLSVNLDKSFNQGITTPFRNGIVWILKKLHAFTIPNFGWDIILFAILFKLLFYPLNQKQAESMKKMQALAPEVKIINEKYAKDPQMKQQKTMELYKKHKANPMGGCLPIIIQIPIFIALYTAFSDTIDLWNEPFLWIKDLSEPDTIYTLENLMGMNIPVNILPLLMVGTQILQTKMTSVSTDPNQKAMMYVMPVVMLYFFWSMPSGVTLYWIMQNVLSVIQQSITNKKDSIR